MPFFENQNGNINTIHLYKLAYYIEKESKPLPRWVYVSDRSVESAFYEKGKKELIYVLPESFTYRYVT